MEDEDSHEKLLNTFEKALIEFIDSDIYEKIPKAKDFKVICMDFDKTSAIVSSKRMLEISTNPVFKIF